MRICNLCKTEKHDSEFYRYNGGLNTRCKKCICDKQREYQKEHPEIRRKRQGTYRKTSRYKERPISLRTRLGMWKRAATHRSIPWNLNLAFLESIPMQCFYSGVELTLCPKHFNTISLDRVDSSKPYEETNVVFCCAKVNTMKNDISKDDFIDFCKKIAKHNS